MATFLLKYSISIRYWTFPSVKQTGGLKEKPGVVDIILFTAQQWLNYARFTHVYISFRHCFTYLFKRSEPDLSLCAWAGGADCDGDWIQCRACKPIEPMDLDSSTNTGSLTLAWLHPSWWLSSSLSEWLFQKGAQTALDWSVGLQTSGESIG